MPALTPSDPPISTIAKGFAAEPAGTLPLAAALPLRRSSERQSRKRKHDDAELAGRCVCGGMPFAVRFGMRSAQRPLFEGRWHCGNKCLDQAVRSAVRREFRVGEIFESRVRHRIPLGLILQMRGVLTFTEVREALALQEQTGEKLGDVLVRHFQVDERRIAAALAAQWSAPLWHSPAEASDELLRLAPMPLFRASGSIPLRLIGSRLSMASADGIDPPIALALERMHGVTVESGIALASSIENAWRNMDSIAQRSVEEIACEDAHEIARRMTRTVEQMQPVEARSVRIGRRMWMRLWLEPAALAGGPCHRDDIVDVLFRLPSATPISRE